MKIAIWGAGRMGKTCCQELHKKDGLEILAVIDADVNKWGKDFYGFPIMSYEKFKEQYRLQAEGVVIGIMNGKAVADIAEILKKDKLCAYVLSNGEESRIIRVPDAGEWIPYLEYDVVEHCNLRCRGCLHFSNIEKEKFSDINEFIKDLEMVKSRFGAILRLRLMGGEPLLHPDLDLFVINARKILGSVDITVVTNGLLIESMPDSLAEVFKNERITMDITLYPPTVKRWEYIRSFLDANKLNYRKTESVTHFRKILSRYAENDIKQSVKICEAAGCTYLSHGRIAKCPLAIRIEKFREYFGEEIYTNSVMDLYDETIPTKEMRKRLMETIDLCSHCPDHESLQEWKVTGIAEVGDWYAEELR